ncbi:Caffeic acid 3-O-methyltransferase 1 [Vitis vinifera]|uniref:Caffeic acid 3-O-methyltransferase 1 n=1 Tax=Vitis vinifera TaxID=29760 RepID=A0A438IF60_VITVI|nr:Caffeic acid 3-O-methyltransferase 1 [Vitis vinifera]
MQTHNGSDGKQEAAEHYSRAMQMATSSVVCMAMHVANELGLFDIIAKVGQASASQIASHLATNNPNAPTMLDRILYVLTAHSLLTCSVDDTDDGHSKRVYGLTPVSKLFARNEDGVSFAPLMALNQDKIFIGSWFEMTNAILEGGIPFDRAHGSNAFEYPRKDLRFNKVFNAAMHNYTTLFINETLESYKGFEHLKEVVDVGGGLGVTLGAITSKYPSIKGINFDLPHVIEHAPHYPGVEHVGGDMFESVPKGETIFMKVSLIVKELLQCSTGAWEGDSSGGVLPAAPETSAVVKAVSQTDLIMMAQNPGGKERTREEFLDLATGAGFAGIRFECFVLTYWVMEFFK